jgi:DNA polymerase-1
VRTQRLHKLLHPRIVERQMLEAYDRERKLIPILVAIERQGIRVSVDRLTADIAKYEKVMAQCEAWLRKRMKVDTEFNLDADQKLVRALADAGMLDLNDLGTTPKSKDEKPTYKADAETLQAALKDHTFAAMLKYRGQLTTSLNTFMMPWLATALKSGGLIFTHWNPIRSEKAGARTGRFSSSPNFQNIPQEFKPIWHHEQAGLPKAPFQLPPLPMCRSYIIPYAPGDVLIDRDFSQQEPRIFGHFEGGPLQQAYNDNPWLDLHNHASDEIFKLQGKRYPRKKTKVINLGLLYGKGVPLLASEIEDSYEVAAALKAAVLRIFPGLGEINRDMRARAIAHEPFRTWGGREYFCEPPRAVPNKYGDGFMEQTYDYKMINCLIQGSGADVTKQALIDFWELMQSFPQYGIRLLLTVHDEILISAPAKHMLAAMRLLRQAMEGIKLDVPMLSEGTVSFTNWAEMKDFDKKGEYVYEQEV